MRNWKGGCIVSIFHQKVKNKKKSSDVVAQTRQEN